MSQIMSTAQIRPKGIVGKNKTLINISVSDIFYMLLCYFMSSCVFFGSRTPLALSAYAAVFVPGKWLVFFVSSLLGLVRYRMDAGVIFYISALVLSTVAMGFLGTSTLIKASCAAFFLLIVSSAENIINSAYWYDYFVTFAECAICFAGVYVFSVSVPLILNAKERRYVPDTEVLSVYVLMALVIRCCSDFAPLAGMEISVILSVIFLMMINSGGGVSAASGMGIVFGLAAVSANGGAVTSAGAFALASIVSGILSRFGKGGTVLGFVFADTVISAFFSGEAIPFDIFEIITASLIFLVIPQGITEYISSLSSKTVRVATKAFVEQDKLQTVISKRLKMLSESYSNLADCYDRCFESKAMSKGYIIRMLDTASSRICPDCGLKYNCWERCCRESYNAMMEMLCTAEKKGVLDTKDVPKNFSSKCIKLNDFVKEFNRMFEVYKVEKLWQKKLNDSRMLVSSQLRGVSNSVGCVASEFEMCLDTAAEKELRSRLDREKLGVRDVTFLKGRGDSFVIEVDTDKRSLTKKEEVRCLEIVENITSQKAVISKSHAKDGITLCFKPSGKYLVSVGKASVCRHGEKVSGDSLIVCENPLGETVAAISDGMGTGVGASAESITATALLGNFVSAGMDVTTALELINSSLLLRSSGDSFATMDVCCVNTMEGTISLFKSGAATGYIKNEEGITQIMSDSLPFGVLSDYGGINKQTISVKDSCLALMMSDGVSDVLNMEDENFIKSALVSARTDNPQIIASQMLSSALEMSDGEAKDDMTVLAINVWRAN